MQPASIALTSEALLTVKELTASPDGFSYKGNDFSYDKVASIGFGASHTNHYFGGPFSPTKTGSTELACLVIYLHDKPFIKVKVGSKSQAVSAARGLASFVSKKPEYSPEYMVKRLIEMYAYISAATFQHRMQLSQAAYAEKRVYEYDTPFYPVSFYPDGTVKCKRKKLSIHEADLYRSPGMLTLQPKGVKGTIGFLRKAIEVSTARNKDVFYAMLSRMYGLSDSEYTEDFRERLA